MAKLSSDAVLKNFRDGTWSTATISNQIRSVGSQSSFPSPDATFYDDKFKRLISFEFKPPSETKRGMLTAIGQAVAYLNNSNLSYILCPETVDGFNIADYFKDLFADQFLGKLPIGLIKYQNDKPEDVEELIKIKSSTVLTKAVKPNSIRDRYWAKHQDLPNQVLFQLLKKAYELPQDLKNRKHELWKKVWQDFIFKDGALDTLDELKPHIYYHYGKPFELGKKTKAKLRKQVSLKQISNSEAIKQLKHWANPDRKGDCPSESYKKNFLTFIGHLNLWDDDCRLQPIGFELHKVGMLNGANSTAFKDRVLKTCLLDGKHLDLILDFHEFSRSRRPETMADLNKEFTKLYSEKGKIKFNPGRRMKVGQNEQFRYEQIFWRKFGILEESYDGNGPLDFNWREIMRVCTASD